MGKAPDFYGPPQGCYWTVIDTDAAASLCVPSDLHGAEYHDNVALLYANTILGPKSQGVNIFGLTLGGTTAAARTITFTTADATMDDYTLRSLGFPVKSGGLAGEYYPIGGPRGVFYDTRAANGYTPGGGFAFTTSNADLIGILWWEPVGAY